MTDSSTALFAMTVQVPTREESGETWAAWNAAAHRCIDIKSALDEETRDQYTREEVFAAFQWMAGVLARVALDLGLKVRDHATSRGHRCGPQGDVCGFFWEEGVVDPRWAVNEGVSVPWLSLWVPTANVDYWAAASRKRLADVLADDAGPLGPLPGKRQHDGQVVLTETPFTQPRRADA